MKQGQITMFILIGIILLVLTAVLYKVFTKTEQAQIATAQAFAEDVQAFTQYVDSCLQDSADASTGYLLGHGNIDPAFDFLTSEGLDVSYFYFEGKTDIPSLEDWETQLALLTELAVTSCVDIQQFEKQGLSIIQGEPVVSVIINEAAIDFTLQYAHTLQQGYQNADVSQFRYQLGAKLPRMHTIAVNITDAVAFFPLGVPYGMLTTYEATIRHYPLGNHTVIYQITDEQHTIDNNPMTLFFATRAVRQET